MCTIKHRFADCQINVKTETLIIGTFNPETEGNEAEFFYGRSKNYLWRLLPAAFHEKDLKQADKQEKLSFIKRNKIDFIDLILKVEVEKGQETNYADSYIDRKVIIWRDVIAEIEKLKFLKRVCFTRKTFSDIPNIRERIDEVHVYCEKNGLLFRALATPSRYYSKDKQAEWTNFLLDDN